jgi:hypothetical protein
VIPREFRQVLAELELVSCGRGYSYNGSGGGKAGSRPPVTGDDDPPHLRYRDAYMRASTDAARERVVSQARDELRRLQGRYERPKGEGETPKAWKARMIREGAGFEAEIVARQFNATARVVKKIRIDHGCNPVDGRPLGQNASVVELHAAGFSLAEIAGAKGLKRWEVHRIVKRAA